jgi:hypothetical protein
MIHSRFGANFYFCNKSLIRLCNAYCLNNEGQAVLFYKFYSSKLKLMNVNNLTKNVVGEIRFYILIYLASRRFVEFVICPIVPTLFQKWFEYFDQNKS